MTELKQTIANINSILIKEITTSYNCITGDNDHLITRLSEAFKKAKKVDIIVSFLMESGVKLLRNDLEELIERNIPIRILTGNYLNITEPQALYLLKDILGDKVDLRFYNVKNKSFHPKAYIFEYEDGGEIFIGSSNVSRSALTTGIEWNYRLSKDANSEDFLHFKGIFEDLFLNKSTLIDEEEMRRYRESWVRPKVYKDLEKLEEKTEENKVINLFEPRGAQIEALYSLKNSRLEGFDKGLVVAATGVGKTYLAAFDSKEFKKILFVAHREEILQQAAQSFKNVRPMDSIGFFYGEHKDKEANILFATVQTLGKSQYLCPEYFNKDEFDYVVVDEFHHAVAGNYKKIIEYFTPKFLLGLTATPERLDNKDVFAICDYNLVYEIRLHDAINRGLLVPFRYYGIYDEEINYDEISIRNGKYDEEQLQQALMINKRAELIYKNYCKYNSKRALGFCVSKKHAEFMAEYFKKQGIKSCAVYSGAVGEISLERKEAIEALSKGELQVVFSVDMFNEGLDIPAVDLVMFLRPTESPTIFLQQLGRGLRKSQGKEYLNVLDFIGNYRKANLIPFFLSGKFSKDSSNTGTRAINPEEFPEDCVVDFDFRLVDIFKRLERSQMKIQDYIREEYHRIKEELGYGPSRVELFTYINSDVYDNMRKKPSLNLFKDYLKFLKENHDLEPEEESLIETDGEEFINLIETTSMSKTYKMPILLAFYNKGELKTKINDEDIYESFREFYSHGSNGIDLAKHKATSDYKNWGKKEYIKLAKDNPIKFLSQTHGDYFYKQGEYFCIKETLEQFKNNRAFLAHMKDAIDLRVMEYYKNRMEERNKES